MHKLTSIVRVLPVVALAMLTQPFRAAADDRRMVWLDEVRVTRPGTFEGEQWFTWEGHTKDASDSSAFFLKEEGEYGINDHMQLGFELPAWHFQNSPEDEKQGPRLDDIGVDLRVILTDPIKDAIGVGFKVETGISEDAYFLEGRVLLQKTIDTVEIAYNLALEARWLTDPGVGRYRLREGELEQSLGVSVEVGNKFFIGAELVHEIPLPDWNTGAQQNVWLGPNASFHRTNWAITVAPLFRVTDSDEEPLYRFRTVLEVDF